ncbi:MAG: hypothetical protein JOZ81_33090 [Chloroflexi bacterium]|nr:hypothetical protein [Chloroflexota bacterium]
MIRTKLTKKWSALLPTMVVTLALVVAGCGGVGYGSHSSSGASGGQASHSTTAQSQTAASSSATGGIPQGNGGDQDPDNNGGPSDGDGNL